jgi:hypothetical protein
VQGATTPTAGVLGVCKADRSFLALQTRQTYGQLPVDEGSSPKASTLGHLWVWLDGCEGVPTVITADAARDSARTLQITQDGPVTLTSCALPPSCNAHHRHCTGSWGLLGRPSTGESTAARNKDTEQIAAAVSTVLITQLSCGDSKRILPVTMQFATNM